jgi:hypothetical protein
MLNALNSGKSTAKKAPLTLPNRRHSLEKKGSGFGLEVSEEVISAAAANTTSLEDEEEEERIFEPSVTVKFVPPYRIDPSSDCKAYPIFYQHHKTLGG